MNLSRRSLLSMLTAVPAVGAIAAFPARAAAQSGSDADDGNTGTPKPRTGTPASVPSTSTDGGSWTYRGDAARSGQMPGPGWSGTPVTRWATELGEPSRSAPAVADGVVFVTIGSGFGAVVAVDAADGTELWRYPTMNAVTASPSVAHGIVYTAESSGNILALDAATGELRWDHATAGYMSGAPSVVDDMVYATCDGNQVYALNAVTGELVWQFDRGLGASGAPAVADGLVFVGAGDFGTDDPCLYALDAVTGEERWSQRLGTWVITAPTVVDGIVYVASSGGPFVAAPEVAAGFDVQTGEEVWRLDLTDSPGAPLLVDEDTMYLTTNLNELKAFNRDDLSLRWTYDDADENEFAPDAFAAVFCDGLIYAPTVNASPGTWSKGIVALDPATGTRTWSWAAPDPERSCTSPAVIDGVVYTSCEDGFLYAIGTED